MKLFKKLIIFIVIAAIVAAAAVWITVTNSRFETVEYTFTSDRVPAAFDGYKIAQVSDLHNKEWEGLAEAVAAAAPDAIFITGDLVSRDDTDFQRDLVSSLVATAPTYFCTGNHEEDNAAYPAIRSALIDLGVKVLEDEFETVTRGEDSIRIAGIVDHINTVVKKTKDDRVSEFDESLTATVDGTDEFTLLLSHQPEYMMLYEAHSVDLVFAGHTHGGAVELPFIGALWAPGQGAFPAYPGGFYETDSSAMIVSRGLGRSTEPFRVNCPYELVICTLSR